MKAFFLILLSTMMNLLCPHIIAHTYTTRIAAPGLPTLPADAPLIVTGDYGVEVEKVLAAGATDIEVDVGSIDKTKIQSVVLNADKVAMNVFTQAADGSGGQSFVLAANKSLAWNVNTPSQINPITVNITKFFLNNPGAVAGTFRASFIMSV